MPGFCSAGHKACGGIPSLAVSNKAASTAAETSSANNAGTVEDPQVLANPGTSLALELSGCKQIEFEVRDDSPGLRYTAPDNTTKWTPVVVSRDGRESEFKVVDPEGIPKNASFQLLHGTPCLRTSYGPSSQVFTPIAKRTRSKVNT